MKTKRTISLLLFICALAACSAGGQAVSQNGNSAAIVAASPANNSADPLPPKTADRANQDLKARIEKIAAEARGKVGVKAVVLETGESVSLKADGRFPMQSVYKFPIGMAILRLADEGKISLGEKVRVEKSEYVRQGMHSPLRDRNPDGGAEVSVGEILRLAVSESDGTASDVLLRLAGGAPSVDKYLKEIGVGGVTVLNTEKEIGQDWETQYRNWATPDSTVELLRAVHEKRDRLSDESRALLIKLMTETPTGQRRLKGLLPAGAVVAHKTGTSGKNAEGVTAATNDVGLITLPGGRHLAIAVFVSDSPADEATREAVIAKIAKAAWDEWGN